jgi:HEPN domain-containing protein
VPKLTTRLTRADFQTLSDIRLREAETLARDGGNDGAIYLAGYSVECALKACIAKDTQQYEFPDKARVNESYTHDFVKLMALSGLDRNYHERMRADDQFGRDWAIMHQWHEDDRYRKDASQPEARDFFAATHRIVEWIRQHW